MWYLLVVVVYVIVDSVMLLHHDMYVYIIVVIIIMNVIRSTSESRPNNIEGKNVRTSVRPQKVSSI